jgi:TonB family protein
VLLSACASTGSLGIDPESSSQARVSLFAASADEDTQQVLPRAVDPRLPSADRLSRRIEAQLGDQARLDIRFCVTPAGQVASATLARSSTMPELDRAVMADVETWQFAAQPGPDSLRTCEVATIVYRPHR